MSTLEGLSAFRIAYIRWDKNRKKGKNYQYTIVCEGMDAAIQYVADFITDERTEVEAIYRTDPVVKIIPRIEAKSPE